MGKNYVSMDHLGSNNQHRETNLSGEHSFEEEGGQFMVEELVLKRASGSVENFAAKFGKMAIINKYVSKFYPCAPAQEESAWRTCVVAIDEFLRRKKRDWGEEAPRLTKVYF